MADNSKTIKEIVFTNQTLVGICKYFVAMLIPTIIWVWSFSSTVTQARTEFNQTRIDLKSNAEATLKLQTDMVAGQNKQRDLEYALQQQATATKALETSLAELKTTSAKQNEEVRSSIKEQWKLSTETSSDVKVLLERTKK